MKKNTLLKILSPIPLFAMLFVIWHFSSQQGGSSGGLSRNLCEWLVNTYGTFFRKTFSSENFESIVTALHPLLRKGAHVAEYFLLTMSGYLVIFVYTIKERYLLATEASVYALAKQKTLTYHESRSRSLSFGFRLLFVVLFSVLIASSDELHQYFVPGRCGCFTDVLIDSIGIAIASLIIWIVHLIKRS